MRLEVFVAQDYFYSMLHQVFKKPIRKLVIVFLEKSTHNMKFSTTLLIYYAIKELIYFIIGNPIHVGGKRDNDIKVELPRLYTRPNQILALKMVY